MRRKRDPKYLWIESSESPSDTGKVWGYLEHETECGWFIRATKEGEKLANQLKILMKTKD
jgi:hypothetical protein